MEQSFIGYSLGEDASSAILWVYPARKPGGEAAIMCLSGELSQVVSDHEGRDSTVWFNNQSITYTVLSYRMPHDDVEVIREDIHEAARLIRYQLAEQGIHQLGVMGASIGGYIAVTATTLYAGTDRPDFQVLFYSVISMDDRLTHLPSCGRVLGETTPENLEETLSFEFHVTADAPHAFIVLAEDDRVVSPLNSIVYYTALLKHGVSAGLYIYPEDGHNFGFRDSFIYKKIWTDKSQKWLLTS